MSTPKTKKNNKSVKKFLNQINNESQRIDCLELLNIFTLLTNEKPVMWGESIVGFGSYRFIYASGNEVDWPATAFSPRKKYISIYITTGFTSYSLLIEFLRKSKFSILFN